MWYDEAIVYQIYPLGFTGASLENDGVVVPRIRKVLDWIPHMKKMGINTVYFCPIFQSDKHGYDTRDYRVLDARLGSNDDFKEVVDALHANEIRVILDGVFNHVGRGFFGFQDVKEKREQSNYRDWFNIDFQGDSGYQDGFWYEGWEGHFELVKLNLNNNEVVEYLLDSVGFWMDEWHIDGLRLDVAYSLDENFIRRLRAFCDDRMGREQTPKGMESNFFLLGEILHGDYRRILNDDMLHSVTDYQCYKGMWSSFNAMNMFEVEYTLNRHYGKNGDSMYVGKHLLNFVDNHDVERIGSILTDKNHLPLIYGLLFGMPGIPCIYYGSEWGTEGRKCDGDEALRPCFLQPEYNHLTEWISKLATIHKSELALLYGEYDKVFLTNRQLIFARRLPAEKQTVLVAINAENEPFVAHFQVEENHAIELISGNQVELQGEYTMPPYSVAYLKLTEK